MLSSQSMQQGNLGGLCSWTSRLHLLCIEKNYNLTYNVTFLGKSYGEWNKVEVPAFFLMSYEGSNEEEVYDYEMVPEIILIKTKM